jgi:hypothetical protein
LGSEPKWKLCPLLAKADVPPPLPRRAWVAYAALSVHKAYAGAGTSHLGMVRRFARPAARQCARDPLAFAGL